jgi:hypothetical protein
MLFLSKLCIVTYTAFRYPDGCGKDKLKVHVVCWRETRAFRRGIFSSSGKTQAEAEYAKLR